MAASKTSRNDTPNTPDVDESKIARMKVDDLRRELKARGVKGTAELKKPELVKKMIKAATSSGSGSGKKTASAAGSGKKTASASASGKKTASASASGKKTASAIASGKKSVSASAKKSTSSSKNPTSRNDTPNTPGVDESKIARMKADDLRRELKARGVKGTADLKKPELVKRYIAAETSGSRSGSAKTSAKSTSAKSSSAKSSSAKSSSANAGSSAAKSGKGGTKGDGGKRTGKNTSSSLKYSQEIKSTSDRPERAGRSLVTTDHEVIRRWAAARNAVPATVEGTDHDGHLGVLRLDFPGYSGDRLTEVSWDDWFEAFDKRRLNFIFQEKQSGGKRSNFFQLENPDE